MRHNAQWAAKVEAGETASYLAELPFTQRAIAEIRQVEVEVERQRAVVAALAEVVRAEAMEER